MYYQMGNFVPGRGAAWALLAERAAVLSSDCADTAAHKSVPAAVRAATEAAVALAAQLADQVPHELRPA